jgi:hypothetical protein
MPAAQRFSVLIEQLFPCPDGGVKREDGLWIFGMLISCPLAIDF